MRDYKNVKNREVPNTVKIKMRSCLLITLLLIMSLFINIEIQAREELESKIDDMEIMAENQYLILYFNEETAEIAVKDKVTRNYWFSNPFTEREMRSDRLRDQFVINYDPRDQSKGSYGYSVEYNQFEIKRRDGGVKIDYDIVEEWRTDDYLPRIISEQALENEILTYLDEDDREFVLESYAMVELIKVPEAEMVEIAGLDQERILENYSVLPHTEVYLEAEKEYKALEEKLQELKAENGDADEIEDIKRDMNLARARMDREIRNLTWLLVRERVMEYRVDMHRLEHLTSNLFYQFRNNPVYILKDIPTFFLSDLAEVFKEIGFTPENVNTIHARHQLDPTQEHLEVFKVSIEYYLDGNSLVVKIPCDEIEYPHRVVDRRGRTHTFPLLSIDFLPYFGTVARGGEGYIMVPDGSGALIDFKDIKSDAPNYNAMVYGRDKTIYIEDLLLRREEIVTKNITLPVFGMNQGNKGFIGIIEEGDSLARISASKASDHIPFHSVNVRFTTIPKGELQISQHHEREETRSSFLELYGDQIYQGDIKVRYQFLGEDNSDYVGMADKFREYLIENRGLERINPAENIPFNLELIGGVSKLKPMMGYPREVIEPMTTYAQVKEIIEEFYQQGINNINLKYRGWLAGGMDNEYPNRVRLLKELGGESEFSALAEYINTKGINFYPELSFLNIYHDDNFAARRYTSRTILNEIAENAHLDSYIFSPYYLQDAVADFLEDYLKYDLNGLAFRYLGSQLNSDMRDRESVVDRERAKELITDVLRSLNNGRGLQVMVNEGNLYTLPYVDSVVNAPITSTGYSIIDRCIPFYQIVLHGYVNYSGVPINTVLAEDFRNEEDYKLKLIETGSRPYYQGSYSESVKLRDTEYDHLFSLNYNKWKDEAVKFYQDFNSIYKDLQDQRIIGHDNLENNVYMTTFEDGTAVIVNYNQTEVNIEDVNIGAKDYKVIEGGL